MHTKTFFKPAKDQGFTIIEVVIVLALAAFIFTIVFFAVPQLQRSLRDNQRQRDVSATYAALLEYQAANEGQIPTNTPMRDEFRARYFDTLDMKNPTTGADYIFGLSGLSGWEPTAAQSNWIVAGVGHQCDGADGFGTFEPTMINSRLAVLVRNDTGNAFICKDSE